MPLFVWKQSSVVVRCLLGLEIFRDSQFTGRVGGQSEEVRGDPFKAGEKHLNYFPKWILGKM